MNITKALLSGTACIKFWRSQLLVRRPFVTNSSSLMTCRLSTRRSRPVEISFYDSDRRRIRRHVLSKNETAVSVTRSVVGEKLSEPAIPCHDCPFTKISIWRTGLRSARAVCTNLGEHKLLPVDISLSVICHQRTPLGLECWIGKSSVNVNCIYTPWLWQHR